MEPKDNRESITSQQSSQFSFELKKDDLSPTLKNSNSARNYPVLNSPTGTSSSFTDSKTSLTSPVRGTVLSPNPRITQPLNNRSNNSTNISTQYAMMAVSPTKLSSQSPSLLSVQRGQSPSGQLSKMEMLSLENEELRNLLLKKDQIIQSLEDQVSILKRRLELSETHSVTPKQLDIPPLDSGSSVDLPPRSANRAKTFPTPVSITVSDDFSSIDNNQNTDKIEPQSIDKNIDTFEDENEDTTIGAGYYDLPEKVPSISTPLSSNSNIDWNAAVEALTASPENMKLHSPEFNTYSNDTITSKSTDEDIKPRSETNKVILAPTLDLLPPPTPPRRPNVSNRPLSPPPNGSVPSLLSKSTLYNSQSSNFNESPEKYPNSTYTTTPQASSYSSQTPTSNYNDNLSPFISQGETDIPLLMEPSQLHTISPQIISTLAPISKTVKKKSSDAEFNIIIGLFDKSSKKEIWRIKKSLTKIQNLNDEIGRILLDTQFGPHEFLIVPNKSVFMNNTPVKVDSRRIELENYFTALFSLELTQIPQVKISKIQYIISKFISGDIVNLLDESNLNVLKNGWLITKRFKGLKYQWKVRYCELDVDGGVFKVEGNNSGFEQISLQNAQIGRQQDTSTNSQNNGSTSNSNDTNDEKAYKHAFIIMEAKKKNNGFNKHIFCAETDNERDIWVNFLIQAVEDCSDASFELKGTNNNEVNETDHENSLISIEYNDSLKAAPSPVTSPLKVNNITDEKEIRKAKKRSFFPFSKKQVFNEFENYRQQQQLEQNNESSSNIEKSLESMNILVDKSQEIPVNSDKIFGNNIIKVFELSNEEIFKVQVPSILSRCINYLIKNEAIYEEGIFRLNGSTSLIKKLKSKFDEESNVNFEQLEPKPDINSIAGLLKLWFREIPGDIIRSDVIHQLERINVTNHNELNLQNWKNIILQLVPKINKSIIYSILKFLNMIIEQQEYNKMNLKNLSIVFSPTLNISNDILTEFLINYEFLFNDGQIRTGIKDISNVSNF